MIFNMSVGGGSGDLNFDVAGGTTQPTNPKENTVWVNTDSDVTAWTFRADEPTSPVEGMVWFVVDVDADASLNAIKKNEIQLYPSYAKQYANGAWVAVEAALYQDGAWVELDPALYLYTPGDEHTDVTGGWKKLLGVTDNQYGYGTLTRNETDLTFTVSSTPGSIAAATTNKIDLTDYSALVVEFSNTGATAEFFVLTSDGNDFKNNNVVRASGDDAVSNVLTADISAVAGLYYIGIRQLGYSQKGTLIVTEVKLVP